MLSVPGIITEEATWAAIDPERTPSFLYSSFPKSGECVINRVVMLIALILAAPLASAGDNVADEAKAWFVTKYVPLWRSIETVDTVKVKEHWVDEFRDHPIDVESRLVDNSIGEWQQTIERYRNGGMQDSILLSTNAERINDFAVLIRARWKDDPPSSPDEPDFCDNYLVGKFQNGWKITHYFTVDCPVE